MRDLNGGFSRLCRSVYGSDAHLFKNRFWSTRIESPERFITTMSYVDLNPVRAGLCSHPSEWPWGSFRAVTGLDSVPDFLSPELFLRGLGSDLDVARREYGQLIDDVVVEMRTRGGV